MSPESTRVSPERPQNVSERLKASPKSARAAFVASTDLVASTILKTPKPQRGHFDDPVASTVY